MWFDTHAHLFAPEFDTDRQAVLQRARQAGVRRILLPNIDTSTIAPLNHLLDTHPHACLGAMGLHPTAVDASWQDSLQTIRRALAQRPYAAIGEIGLDLYWDTTYARQQEDAFRAQLQWVLDLDRPALIHARNAMGQVLDIISSPPYRHLRCALHAFTGTPDDARRAMRLPGTYIGLGGICTFKKGLHPDVYPLLRHDRLLLETDAPYLAPTPLRGQRNESAHIPLIAQHLAPILGLTLPELARITTANAHRLLALPS